MKIKNNTTNQQFEIEIEIEDDLASLVYRFNKNTMYFMHTKVPESAQGKGVASHLAKTALGFAKDENYKIAILPQNMSKGTQNGMIYMMPNFIK